MKLAFHATKPQERILARAFIDGMACHGDAGEIVDPSETPYAKCDVAAFWGVKSRDCFHAHKKARVQVLMLDKGYIRPKLPVPVRDYQYCRVAVGAHHPTRYLMSMDCPADRFLRLGIEIQPWRADGDHVVIAGSSEKYHRFHGLDHPTLWAKVVVKELGDARPIVYRPKPSWKNKRPIAGTVYSVETPRIDFDLPGAWAMVTHGSNSCFEALVSGIPSIVLGDGITRPISSTSLNEIAAPRLAAEHERKTLLSNLAYCQWTVSELRSGAAWPHIKAQILAN